MPSGCCRLRVNCGSERVCMATQLKGKQSTIALAFLVIMSLSIGTRTARLAVISRARITNVASSSYNVIRPWHVLSGSGLDPYGGNARRIRPPTFRWHRRWSAIQLPSTRKNRLIPSPWDGVWPPETEAPTTQGIKSDGQNQDCTGVIRRDTDARIVQRAEPFQAHSRNTYTRTHE